MENIGFLVLEELGLLLALYLGAWGRSILQNWQQLFVDHCMRRLVLLEDGEGIAALAVLGSDLVLAVLDHDSARGEWLRRNLLDLLQLLALRQLGGCQIAGVLNFERLYLLLENALLLLLL